MDVLTAALGFATGILLFIIAFMTVWSRMRNGIKAAAREVLIESGLIKPNENQKNWPNGYENLPDVLHELHTIVQDIRNGRQ